MREDIATLKGILFAIENLFFLYINFVLSSVRVKIFNMLRLYQRRYRTLECIMFAIANCFEGLVVGDALRWCILWECSAYHKYVY